MTLEDELIEQGEVASNRVACKGCGTMLPTFALSADGRICANCLIGKITLANAPEPEITWDEIRARRKALLSLSDGNTAVDAPKKHREPWLQYRQALRDLPDQFDTAADVVWPEPPQ